MNNYNVETGVCYDDFSWKMFGPYKVEAKNKAEAKRKAVQVATAQALNESTAIVHTYVHAVRKVKN